MNAQLLKPKHVQGAVLVSVLEKTLITTISGDFFDIMYNESLLVFVSSRSGVF